MAGGDSYTSRILRTTGYGVKSLIEQGTDFKFNYGLGHRYGAIHGGGGGGGINKATLLSALNKFSKEKKGPIQDYIEDTIRDMGKDIEKYLKTKVGIYEIRKNIERVQEDTEDMLRVLSVGIWNEIKDTRLLLDEELETLNNNVSREVANTEKIDETLNQGFDDLTAVIINQENLKKISETLAEKIEPTVGKIGADMKVGFDALHQDSQKIEKEIKDKTNPTLEAIKTAVERGGGGGGGGGGGSIDMTPVVGAVNNILTETKSSSKVLKNIQIRSYKSVRKIQSNSDRHSNLLESIRKNTDIIADNTKVPTNRGGRKPKKNPALVIRDDVRSIKKTLTRLTKHITSQSRNGRKTANAYIKAIAKNSLLLRKDIKSDHRKMIKISENTLDLLTRWNERDSKRDRKKATLGKATSLSEFLVGAIGKSLLGMMFGGVGGLGMTAMGALGAAGGAGLLGKAGKRLKDVFARKSPSPDVPTPGMSRPPTPTPTTTPTTTPSTSKGPVDKPSPKGSADIPTTPSVKRTSPTGKSSAVYRKAIDKVKSIVDKILKKNPAAVNRIRDIFMRFGARVAAKSAVAAPAGMAIGPLIAFVLGALTLYEIYELVAELNAEFGLADQIETMATTIATSVGSLWSNAWNSGESQSTEQDKSSLTKVSTGSSSGSKSQSSQQQLSGSHANTGSSSEQIKERAEFRPIGEILEDTVEKPLSKWLEDIYLSLNELPKSIEDSFATMREDMANIDANTRSTMSGGGAVEVNSALYNGDKRTNSEFYNRLLNSEDPQERAAALVAWKESRGGTNLWNAESRTMGLFQFKEKTWNSAIEKMRESGHIGQDEVWTSQDRNDPEKAYKVFKWVQNDDMNAIRKRGHAGFGLQEAPLLNLLGRGDTLKMLESNQNEIAANIAPAAMAANRNLFYEKKKNGERRALSVAEFRQNMKIDTSHTQLSTANETAKKAEEKIKSQPVVVQSGGGGGNNTVNNVTNNYFVGGDGSGSNTVNQLKNANAGARS